MQPGIRTHRFVISANFLTLGGEGLDLPLGHAELVKGDLELALDLVVMSLELNESQGLLLEGLLQIDVGLVGDVERHLQLGDLDLELLLDALHLGLQPGLGLDHARVELLDFNAVLLAEKKGRV